MNLLALAGDAGGAQALTPVIRQLSAMEGMTVDCRAYAAAASLWSAAGFQPKPPEPLEVRGMDRVLLGTTVGPEQWELEAIRRARTERVRTLAVLDSWVHYRERFLARDGSLCLPDTIAIMDEQAKTEMIVEGFPSFRLAVTGQPAFDQLAAYEAPEPRAEARERLRAWAGYREEERCVLYVSQPLSQFFSRESLGFHETEVLLAVTETLEQLLERRGTRATLLVKPHPRETLGAAGIPHSVSRRLEVRLAPAEFDRLDLVVGSDLTVGMNSMLLMEACFLGQPVVSYQPYLQIPDSLPSNRRGWSRAVYRPEALVEALDGELFDPMVQASRQQILAAIPRPRGAADRVVGLLLASEAARC